MKKLFVISIILTLISNYTFCKKRENNYSYQMPEFYIYSISELNTINIDTTLDWYGKVLFVPVGTQVQNINEYNKYTRHGIKIHGYRTYEISEFNIQGLKKYANEKIIPRSRYSIDSTDIAKFKLSVVDSLNANKTCKGLTKQQIKWIIKEACRKRWVHVNNLNGQKEYYWIRDKKTKRIIF